MTGLTLKTTLLHEKRFINILAFIMLAVLLLAAGSADAAKYNRDDWPHWLDLDHDCQDTRQEILIRDAQGPLKYGKGRCYVTAGVWQSPYTGERIYKASKIDIDHIIPLAHAFHHGGDVWSKADKARFANDPENLLATDAKSNRTKSASGPAKWRPMKSYWCEYATRWHALKIKYALRIDPSEQRALDEMLGTCPGRAMLRAVSESQDQPATAAGLTSTAPAPSVIAATLLAGVGVGNAAADEDPTYACGKKTYCSQMVSCEEAKFYLATCGLYKLDRDSDGTPCESVCH